MDFFSASLSLSRIRRSEKILQNITTTGRRPNTCHTPPPLHCCPCGPTHRPVRAPLHFISMEIETAASQKIGKGRRRERGQQYVEEGFSSGRWWKAERIVNISPPHSSQPSRMSVFPPSLANFLSSTKTDKRKEILDFSSNLSSCVPLRTKKQNQDANFNLPWMFSDVPFLHRDIQFCFPRRPKATTTTIGASN